MAILLALAALAWWLTAGRMAGMDAGPGTELGALGLFLGVWVMMMAAASARGWFVGLVVGVALGVCAAPARAASSPTAYVVNEFSNTVTPIDTATNTPGTVIPVGSQPVGSRSPRTAGPPTSPTSRYGCS